MERRNKTHGKRPEYFGAVIKISDLGVRGGGGSVPIQNILSVLCLMVEELIPPNPVIRSVRKYFVMKFSRWEREREPAFPELMFHTIHLFRVA